MCQAKLFKLFWEFREFLFMHSYSLCTKLRYSGDLCTDHEIVIINVVALKKKLMLDIWWG